MMIRQASGTQQKTKLQCGDKGRPTKLAQAKAIYSGLALAKESSTVTQVQAEAQRLAKEWEGFVVEKREGVRYVAGGIIEIGQGCLAGFPPIGPKLEAGTNMRRCQLVTKSWPFVPIVTGLLIGFLDFTRELSDFH